MTEGEKQLRREHRQLHERRLYFLLAAAGTSIGFAVTQIDDSHATKALYVLVLALTFLGVSFFSGLMALSVESRLLSVNSMYLQEIPKAEAVGYSADNLRKIVDKQAFNPLIKKMNFWNASQIWSLFAGGALLPIWKILTCNECTKVLLSNIW